MYIQDQLRREKEIEFEGVAIRYLGDWMDLAPGDTYMAERNNGPQLLTVRYVDYENIGCVFPVEREKYPYDLYECVKVKVLL